MHYVLERVRPDGDLEFDVSTSMRTLYSKLLVLAGEQPLDTVANDLFAFDKATILREYRNMKLLNEGEQERLDLLEGNMGDAKDALRKAIGGFAQIKTMLEMVGAPHMHTVTIEEIRRVAEVKAIEVNRVLSTLQGGS